MAAHLKPGDLLRERYQIVEVIGQGGMGCVYKAADLRLEGRYTAIKATRYDFTEPAADEEAIRAQDRQQFQREASTLARLDHPMLPKVSDFFSQEGRDYLVMDFVPGIDLRQAIEQAVQRGESLAEAQVLEWARQLIDGLAYLHSQTPPVLHRDIKPANIKLTPEGAVKLVDFGLVRQSAQDDQRTITVLQGRGTAPYTPLEQVGSDLGQTDARSDLYALGATLYHLLTLVPPAEARQRFLTPHVLRGIREINPAVSERAARAVLWAMAMHPDERPRDAHELGEAIFGAEGAGLRRAGTRWAVGHSMPGDRDRDDALRQGNLALGVLAVVLLALALVVTLV